MDRPRPDRVGPDVCPPGPIERRARRDGVDAVHEEDRRARTPGLVVAAGPPVAEGPALVELAERDGRVQLPPPDDRQGEVRVRMGDGEAGRCRLLGEEDSLAAGPVQAWGGRASLGQGQPFGRIVDRDDQVDHGRLEVAQFLGQHAADRRIEEVAAVLVERGRDARLGRRQVARRDREMRDPDRRTVGRVDGEGPRQGRVRADQRDPEHDDDQCRRGGDRADGDGGGGSPAAKAGKGQRDDRPQRHRGSVTCEIT